MSNILTGKEVAAAINERCRQQIEELKKDNITPTLAIMRVGEKENDLSYERTALKRCETIGVNVEKYVFDENVNIDEFYGKLLELNKDDHIHGILIFRPLPKRFDDKFLRSLINPKKDVDGCTNGSLAGVFTNTLEGFAPCTAQAVMEILDYYHIDVTGKNVVVLGRSLVIGKPVSMMLLNKNATVTICHTKTINVQEIAQKADIIIAATGQMESIDSSYISHDQTIIDVGLNFSVEKGKLCGDVNFDDINEKVANITPVPGGVGSVTTSVLVSHVVDAAMRFRDEN